jgi:hypothetical protein
VSVRAFQRGLTKRGRPLSIDSSIPKAGGLEGIKGEKKKPARCAPHPVRWTNPLKGEAK